MRHQKNIVPRGAPSFPNFFTERAKAFENRDYEKVVDSLGVPTSVYVLENMLLLSETRDAIAALAIHRSNLDKIGYASTETNIQKLSWISDLKAEIDTCTKHFDANRSLITEANVRYFVMMTPETDSGLTIELIEMLTANESLSDGLQLL